MNEISTDTIVPKSIIPILLQIIPQILKLNPPFKKSATPLPSLGFTKKGSLLGSS